MLFETTSSVQARIVGSSGVIELPSGSQLVDSGAVGTNLYSIRVPHVHNGLRVRVAQEDILNCLVLANPEKLALGNAVASEQETKRESARRVLEILSSETLLGALRRVTSTPEKHVLDLGSAEMWPYLNDRSWLHKVNIELKHPSLTIETLKMQDGWHLVIVLHHNW